VGCTGSCEETGQCSPAYCYAPAQWCNSLPNTTSTSSCAEAGSVSCVCRIFMHTASCLHGSCTQPGSCSYKCNSGFYDTNLITSDGCENSTPSYLFTFQRYTFDLSQFSWSYVTQVKFCLQGNYSSTGGTSSSNMMYYNATSSLWVRSTAIPTSNGLTCLTFTGSSLNNIKSGTTAYFALRGNQSLTGYALALSSDYAYLIVTQ